MKLTFYTYLLNIKPSNRRIIQFWQLYHITETCHHNKTEHNGMHELRETLGKTEKKKRRFASDFVGRLTVRHFVRVERREARSE